MAPLLGGIDQAFQFIQEYTGVVSPGILAIFMLGLFWQPTTNSAAIYGALSSIPVALGLKFFTEQPWMHQMGITFLTTVGIMILISHFQGKGQADEKGIPLDNDLFKTTPAFNIHALVIMLLCSVLYFLFW